jgi:hypothetical protein
MLRDIKFNTTANTNLAVTGLLVKKDDVLVAAKIIDNTGDTFTFPTGFVQIPGSPFATTFDAQQLAVATKVATLADEGASFSLDSANNGIGLVASYRDVYAPSALDVTPASSINNSGVASPFPIVLTGPQTIHDGCDLVWIAASDVNAGVDVVHTPPEGFLIRADIQGATVANFMNMAIADRIQRVHGPTGKLSGTGTAAGNSAAYAVVVIALRRKPVMPTRLRRPLASVGGGGSTYNMALAEAASASDSVSALAVLPAALTESGSASDAVSALLVAVASIAEVAAASDAVGAGGSVYGVQLSESGSAADSLSGGSIFATSLAETGSAADSVSNALAAAAAVSEAANATDQLSTTLVAVAVVSEAASGADVVSSIATRVASIAESGSAADTVDGSTSGSTYSVSVLESGSAADQVSSLLVASRALAESGNAADALTSLMAALAQISESATAASSVASTWSGFTSLAEVGAAIDLISADGQIVPGKRIVVVRGKGIVSARARSTVTAVDVPRAVQLH